METRPSAFAGNNSTGEDPQGGCLLRQLEGDSRTAAEVAMEHVLMSNDGIDLIIAELDRYRVRTKPPRLSELSTWHHET